MPSFQSKPDSREVAVGFARLFLVFSLWILALQKDFLFLGNPTSLRQRLLLVFDSGFRMTRTYDTTTLHCKVKFTAAVMQRVKCSHWELFSSKENSFTPDTRSCCWFKDCECGDVGKYADLRVAVYLLMVLMNFSSFLIKFALFSYAFFSLRNKKVSPALHSSYCS